MDLTTATPVAVDTEIAAIYVAFYAIGREVAQQEKYLKDYTDRIAQVEAGTYRYSYSAKYDGPKWAKAAEDLTAKVEALNEQAREMMRSTKPYNAEYTRRGGWTRFFLVQNNGGHIHSSMNCSTCNKMGKATEFGWLPELSGQSEPEAVAAHGAILCTTCYPSAPVAWTDGRKADDDLYCTGGGRYYVQPSRTGYYSGNWGTCPECGTRQTVSKADKVRKHKK